MRFLPIVLFASACVKPSDTDAPCIATTEVCNGVDDDCDGFADNFPTDGVTTFEDRDGDGRGDGNTPLRSCDPASGRVEDGSDCDDGNAAVWQETEGYADRDVDGFGDPNSPVSGCGGTSVADFTDCDDGAVDVNPAAFDLPGDGIDQDCDGLDAFGDEDGDGYDLDDCDDADPSVNPSADEVWYDGVDQDCSGGDDFDQDGDGFPFPIDCNDEDATIYPGAGPDVFGDGIDTDCFGGDAIGFIDGGTTWDDARNVVVARNERDWMIITAAQRADGVPYLNAGIGLVFDETGSTEIAEALSWFVPQTNATAQVVGRRVDADSGPAGIYAGLAYTNEPTCRPSPCTAPPPSTFLMAKFMYWDATQHAYRNRITYRQIATVNETFVDVDLRAPANDNVSLVGCGPRTAAFVVADASPQFNYVAKGCIGDGNCDPGPLVPSPATSCFVEPTSPDGQSARGTVCDATTCTTYSLVADAMVPSEAQEYSQRTWRTQESRGDWIVRTSADGVQYLGPAGSGTSLAGLDVLDAEIYADGGRVYIAAVVQDQDGDGLRDVALTWGEPGTELRQVVFPAASESGPVDVRSAALATEGQDTFLAISGAGPRGDVVAWAWTKLP